MALIVQKFGGSSVADTARIRNVARIITETYRKGNNVVVVLSAQGDTTDDLIEKAQEINPKASRREMDMLLSTGEQISCSLCAMAIEAMGYPVVSLTGWQAGFRTNSVYSDARIKRIDTERVLAELDKKAIVIVTGIVGALLAETVCKLFHITDPIAKGVGIGTAAHAVGTSKALEIGEVEGAMSGLSVAVAGIMTAVLCPLFSELIH